MKQAAIIPIEHVQAIGIAESVSKGEAEAWTAFKHWLEQQEGTLLIMPKRPEGLHDMTYSMGGTKIRTNLNRVNERWFVLEEGSVKVPDFELDLELEPLIQAIARLEERRQEILRANAEPRHIARIQEDVIALTRFIGLDRIEVYLEPFRDEDGKAIETTFFPGERNRYIMWHVVQLCRTHLAELAKV